MCKMLNSLLLLMCLGMTAAAQVRVAATPADVKTEAEQAELRGKAVEMLHKTARQLHDMRATENRVSWQLQLATLLWPHDAAQARAVWDEAAAGWKELLGKAGDTTETPGRNIYNTINLRQTLTRTLARYDGPAALQFVRSTREQIAPYLPENYGPEAEVALETEIAAQLVRTDPQAALKIAQDSLAQGTVTGSHVNVFNQLRNTDRVAAQGLGRQIYERVREADFLQGGAGYAGYALVQTAHNELRNGPPPNGQTPLLTETELRGLTERLTTAALSFTPDRVTPGYYSTEYNAARNLLNMLGSWPDLEKYAPGRRAENQARNSAMDQASTPNPQRDYSLTVQQKPLPEALHKISTAPPEMREGLYQQAAWKAAQSGDLEQARSIISTYLRNPQTRARALRQAEQQAFYFLVGKGQITEARAVLTRTGSGPERSAMLVQLAAQLIQQDKKDEALPLLDEARDQLPPRPAGPGQLPVYFRLLQHYQQIDPARAFALLEPWLEQFNEMAAAAEKLDDFAGDFYREGEFLPGGHPLAGFVNHFTQSFGLLAQADFDRIQTQIGKFQRPEMRVMVSLAIGRQILEINNRPGVLRQRPNAPPPPRTIN